jgi:hypothetical protein
VVADTEDGIFEHTITGFLYHSSSSITVYDQGEISGLRWIALTDIQDYFTSLDDVRGVFENERILFYWEDFVKLYLAVQKIFIKKICQ